MRNSYTPITATLVALHKRLSRQIALAGYPEFAEAAAWEVIRAEAEKRDYDRARPGDQRFLAWIACVAERERNNAHDWLLWDRQDLENHGYQTVRLSSLDPVCEEAYAALPSGRWYRLDGELRRKP